MYFSILCPVFTRKWQKLWTVSLANNFILNFVAMAHINPSSNYRSILDKLSILTAFLVKNDFHLCYVSTKMLYYITYVRFCNCRSSIWNSRDAELFEPKNPLLRPKKWFLAVARAWVLTKKKRFTFGVKNLFLPQNFQSFWNFMWHNMQGF